MTLKTDIQKIVKDVFASVDTWGFATSVTYIHHTGNPTYDPETRVTTAATTSYSVKMLLTSYENKEIDNVVIMGTDKKAMIASKDLAPTPSLKDTITIDSVTHEIMNIEKDPADAMWVFQIRKP